MATIDVDAGIYTLVDVSRVPDALVPDWTTFTEAVRARLRDPPSPTPDEAMAAAAEVDAYLAMC